MMQGWNLLLGEIWGLLALAALVGLLAGWLIGGRRRAATSAQYQDTAATGSATASEGTGETLRLQAALDTATAELAIARAELARLQAATPAPARLETAAIDAPATTADPQQPAP